MIWDVDSYIIYEPGIIAVPFKPPGPQYPIDEAYRARVEATYQQMVEKQQARWQARKHGSQGRPDPT